MPLRIQEVYTAGPGQTVEGGSYRSQTWVFYVRAATVAQAKRLVSDQTVSSGPNSPGIVSVKHSDSPAEVKKSWQWTFPTSLLNADY